MPCPEKLPKVGDFRRLEIVYIPQHETFASHTEMEHDPKKGWIRRWYINLGNGSLPLNAMLRDGAVVDGYVIGGTKGQIKLSDYLMFGK